MPTVPETMTAVHLTGHGGFDRLELRQDVPVPRPAPDEVLIRVLACGVNNTDINTRTGWYAKSVTGGTGQGSQAKTGETGSWSGTPLAFPIIQGADVCGEIVGTGSRTDAGRIGERVIVSTMQPHPSGKPFACITMGSEINGGFAQYVAVRSATAFKLDSDWSDVELASIPCAWSTAENLLHRADVTAEDSVLITGASGGVGSAAVQLAKRRGARVTAVCGKDKTADVQALGADRTVGREVNLAGALGRDAVDVVVDLVAGPAWPHLPEILRPGGRYAVAGAIAGPMVELDVRTLYLKDLSFFGCTFQDPVVFPNLVAYIESGEIRPVVAKTYALADIVRAQEDFLEKKFIGKLVLVPPH